jgi:hypothetical protein
MSQIGRSGASQPSPSASSNIYTVLVFVALVALAVGIVYICVRSIDLFGTVKVF